MTPGSANSGCGGLVLAALLAAGCGDSTLLDLPERQTAAHPCDIASQLELTPLTALGQAPRAPFSSPDGRWIGFVEPVPVTLKKVAITGGPALDLCRLDSASRGATWGDDG